MLRLGTIVLGADDVDRAVGFWQHAMGYDVHRFDNSANNFTILVPPDRVGTRIAVQRTDTPAQPAPRVHLDLIVDSADEQRAEIDRLVTLGADVVDWAGYSGDDDFVVLADTEGNRFCVVDASHG